jgi:hypothetical protein
LGYDELWLPRVGAQPLQVINLLIADPNVSQVLARRGIHLIGPVTRSGEVACDSDSECGLSAPPISINPGDWFSPAHRTMVKHEISTTICATGFYDDYGFCCATNMVVDVVTLDDKGPNCSQDTDCPPLLGHPQFCNLGMCNPYALWQFSTPPDQPYVRYEEKRSGGHCIPTIPCAIAGIPIWTAEVAPSCTYDAWCANPTDENGCFASNYDANCSPTAGNTEIFAKWFPYGALCPP